MTNYIEIFENTACKQTFQMESGVNAVVEAAKKDKQKVMLEAILSFIDEGVDELLIRRVWERALRV